MPQLKSGRLRGSIMQNYPARNPRRGNDEGVSLWIRLLVLLALLSALVGGGFWLWNSGWPHRQYENFCAWTLSMTKKAGFSVKNVVVEGRLHIEKNELISALDTTNGAPLFAFDPDKALERIMRLTWANQAIVMRRMPDTIYVYLMEREPIARWQHAGKVMIIDREGRELPNVRSENFGNLPLVVGEEAPKETAALLDDLVDFPIVIDVLSSAVRVNDRRWNLVLNPKIIIKLPEQNLKAALQKLTTLLSEQKIIERGVVAVDLRLPDRMFLETGAPQQKTDGKP